MKNATFKRIIKNPITPLVCFILGGVVNEYIIMPTDMNWLYIIELALGIIGLISAFTSLNNKWARYIAIILMSIMAIDSSSGLYRFIIPIEENSTKETTKYQQRQNTHHNSHTKYDTVQIRNFEEDEINVNKSRTCLYCSGTGKCHVCHGLGSNNCHGPVCMGGVCMDCRGTGIYNGHSCIVCSGRGMCQICHGRGKVNCTWCTGTGKCDNCKGSGIINL